MEVSNWAVADWISFLDLEDVRLQKLMEKLSWKPALLGRALGGKWGEGLAFSLGKMFWGCLEGKAEIWKSGGDVGRERSFAFENMTKHDEGGKWRMTLFVVVGWGFGKMGGKGWGTF